MAQTPEDKKTDRKKAKLTHPDAFLDEMDGDPSQDADALLAEFAPQIDHELNQLNADFAELNIEIESLNFDGDDSAVDSISIKQRLINLKKKIKVKVIAITDWIFYNIKYLFIWAIFEAPKKVLIFIKKIFQQLSAVFIVYKHWSIKRKGLFFFAFFGLASMTYFYISIVKNRILYQDSFHFYGSMAEIADFAFSYNPKLNLEPFYNSPRVKAYSFQMKPVVVNLKRNNTGNANPMGFFEFVFEGNSGDVVVELKSRESEFEDLIERVVESYSYESLETTEGKINLKEDLRIELNKQLTEGIVQAVELRNVFIKP